MKKKKVRKDQITLTQFDPTEGLGPDDLLQKRPIKGKGGKKIDVEFYWPAAPTGPTAGYTAPLKGRKETVNTGLTTEPIALDRKSTRLNSGHNRNSHAVFCLKRKINENRCK